MIIDDSLRTLLYYPLGLLPIPFFTSRMLLQWFQSEKQRTSVVTPLFWYLSLIGNCLLLSHYFIQLQFPFALFQLGNGMIAWRNLQIQQNNHLVSTQRTLLNFFFAALFFTLLYLAQCFFFAHALIWTRIPLATGRTDPSSLVHLMGVIGSSLFASRFWVQWWQAERTKKSELKQTFWWLSLIGTLLSLTYFFVIQDRVSLLHTAFVLIPCIRNLFFLTRPSLKMGKA